MAEADRPIGNYPPERHLLRDLAAVFDHGEGGRRMRVEVVPELLNDRGTLDAGVAAVLVDIQSGGAALEHVQPDWMVTSDMTLHMARPVRTGAMIGRTRVLRAGRNNVVLETELLAEGEEAPSVSSQLGFTRIARRDDTPRIDPDDEAPARTTFALPGSGFDAPVYEKLGLRTLDAAAGRLELDLRDYQRNSVGAMQGGVVVALATRSAEAIGRATLAAPVTTTDLTAHYLALGRPGPLRSEALVVRSDADAVVARIELRDVGQDDRLCAIVTATARCFE
jgi:uncharacterized protein (TIGR00369 family)